MSVQNDHLKNSMRIAYSCTITDPWEKQSVVSTDSDLFHKHILKSQDRYELFQQPHIKWIED